jgi:hypothetical protein
MPKLQFREKRQLLTKFLIHQRSSLANFLQDTRVILTLPVNSASESIILLMILTSKIIISLVILASKMITLSVILASKMITLPAIPASGLLFTLGRLEKFYVRWVGVEWKGLWVEIKVECGGMEWN